jgi:hypothetical protein
MPDVLLVLSLKLRQELSRLVPPYIALDFDQHAIAQGRTKTNFRIGDFETIKHLARFGRPLYVLFHVPLVLTFIVVSDGTHRRAKKMPIKMPTKKSTKS